MKDQPTIKDRDESVAPAPEPDAPDAPLKLTPKQEAFALDYVASRNASHAYRAAYNVGPNTKSRSVWESASALLANERIAARVKQLREVAASETLVQARELIQDWIDIATADPNELVRVERGACRHCYGVDHAYQWLSSDEFVDACETAIDDAVKRQRKPKMPTMLGGFGYNPTLAPIASCAHCFGEGHARTLVADTTTLSPKALKLYAGAKETKDGIEIKLHDQQKARESLARCLGLFNDKLDLGKGVSNPGAAVALPKGVSADEAQRIYADLIAS